VAARRWRAPAPPRRSQNQHSLPPASSPERHCTCRRTAPHAWKHGSAPAAGTQRDAPPGPRAETTRGATPASACAAYEKVEWTDATCRADRHVSS
jgi:hypothetical protein